VVRFLLYNLVCINFKNYIAGINKVYIHEIASARRVLSWCMKGGNIPKSLATLIFTVFMQLYFIYKISIPTCCATLVLLSVNSPYLLQSFCILVLVDGFLLFLLNQTAALVFIKFT